MSRLVEAKVELAEACDRWDEAERQCHEAQRMGSVSDLLTAARRRAHERRVIATLTAEVREIEAHEAAFGPGVAEELS